MPTSEATQILFALNHGDRSGTDRLMELVYDELRSLAARYLVPRKPREPLQPTELVHEAFIKLVDKESTSDWRSRSHFYAVAATVMRHLLVDEARKRMQQKRGGGQTPLALADTRTISVERDEDVVELDDALSDLERTNQDRARLVELRFFGGMTMDEIAEVSGQSKRTLEREWTVTRAWLRRRLAGNDAA